MPILNTEETGEIVASWEIVRHNPEENGLKFFQYLFLKHPDVRKQFFPHLDTADDVSMRIHGAKVIDAVGSMVLFAQSEDDVKLVDKITQIARSHYHRGVGSTTFYQVVTSTLMEYLSKELGPLMTEKGVQAWTKFLDTLVAVVGSEVEKMDGNQCLGVTPCIIS